MPYHYKCRDCQHEFNRSYLSLSKKCRNCGSIDLIIYHPPRKAGFVVLGIGGLLLVLYVVDMSGLFRGGAGSTLLGKIIMLIYGPNLLAYLVATLIMAILIGIVILNGLDIVLRKRWE